MAEVIANGNDSFSNGPSAADFNASLKEVEGLTDEELYEKLKSTGKTVGPVVDSTRTLYRKQLAAILCSPGGTPSSPVTNGTNGTAEANGDDGSDSDNGSLETSSRASRSSRSSSLPKKTRGSLKSTPKPTETFEDCVSSETPTKKEKFVGASFSTPARSSKTFEEYVAESEARKSRSATATRREQAYEVAAEGERGFIGSFKMLVVIAVFAAIAAYGFILYRNSKLDPDAAIDEEIEALRQKYLSDGTPAPQ